MYSSSGCFSCAWEDIVTDIANRVLMSVGSTSISSSRSGNTFCSQSNKIGAHGCECFLPHDSLWVDAKMPPQDSLGEACCMPLRWPHCWYSAYYWCPHNLLTTQTGLIPYESNSRRVCLQYLSKRLSFCPHCPPKHFVHSRHSKHRLKYIFFWGGRINVHEQAPFSSSCLVWAGLSLQIAWEPPALFLFCYNY